MRLVVIILLLLPLTVPGQNTSDFGVSRSAHSSTGNMGEYQLESDVMSLASIEFEHKKDPATVIVHPNPSSRDLHVTLNGNGRTGKVIVYDILGNIKVEGKAFQLNSNSTTWSHNVSAWHSGTYVVRVLQDESVVKSLRFIKN